MLRQAGFDILEAGTGEDALRRVAQQHPDLVLLDTRLPDIPGSEVCRRIKALPQRCATPVLQTSATQVDDNPRVAALDGGADGYIAAPLNRPCWWLPCARYCAFAPSRLRRKP